MIIILNSVNELRLKYKMCFVRKIPRNENRCNCVTAVKSTYISLIEIGYRPCEALHCAMKLLKIRHPEIPNWKIPKMTARIINPYIIL